MARGWVISGNMKRFATASMVKALRITDPVASGSGMISGLEAGDFVEGILSIVIL